MPLKIWRWPSAFLSRMLAAAALALAAIVATPAAFAQTSPSDYTSSARYDVMGRQTGAIKPDPDGTGALKYSATRHSYDARGNLTKTETGELANWKAETIAPANWGGDFTILSSVETVYDIVNRKIKTLAKGSNGVIVSVTQYSYDNRGRLLCTVQRMNAALFASPPASACTLGTQGSDGPDRITRNIYDAASQILKVQQAVGTTIQQDYVTYSYTANGQQASVTDANGNVAAFTYDGHDRLIKWNFPSKTITGQSSTTDFEQYTYDDNSNRLTLRKRDGLTITYAYDTLNRMTVKTVPAKAGVGAIHTRNVHYQYDLRGLQTKARFGGLTGPGVDNAYDGFGRMVSSTNAMGGTPLTLSYQYDANGNRTRITHPDGNYFTHSYDGLNRNKTIRENGSSANMVKSAYYNNRGLMKSNILGFGFNSSATFDPVGRVVTIKTTLPDNAGGGNDGNIFGFAYTASSQIKSRTTSNDAYTNTAHYDVDRSYAVNGLNQYTSAGPAAFLYDDNGNLTSDGSVTFTYDVENRLVQASGARNATLMYDPLGRLWEVSNGTNAGIQRFLYDGDAMVAEYDYLGNLTERYVHGGGVDNPLVWYEGGNVDAASRRHLFANWQGSITAITDATGAAIAINGYDAYGIPNATNVGRFQYTGQIWLAELGLYHYKARVYSPTLGRFLQTDPIGYEDQFNLYAYVGGDPVNLIDPTGQYSQDDKEEKGMLEIVTEATSEVVNTILDIGETLIDYAVEDIEGGIELFTEDIKQAVSNPSASNIAKSVATTICKPCKAVAGTGRRAGGASRATAKGVRYGPPKVGKAVKKSDAPKIATRGGRKGGVVGSKTQAKKFGKGKGPSTGRVDRKGHKGGPPHNHPPKGKQGHLWWPF